MLGFGFWLLTSQCALVLSTFNQRRLIDSSRHSLAHAAGYCFLEKSAPETKRFDVSSTEVPRACERVARKCGIQTLCYSVTSVPLCSIAHVSSKKVAANNTNPLIAPCRHTIKRYERTLFHRPIGAAQDVQATSLSFRNDRTTVGAADGCFGSWGTI